MFIYQIELSNLCSLRCSYCPHPGQQRKRGLMSLEVFGECVSFHRKHSLKRPLYLHHFGEPTLHPELGRFIELAAGQGVECSFSTNGMRSQTQSTTSEYWEELAAAGLKRISFSTHLLSLDKFRTILPAAISITSIFSPKNGLGTWAGQVGPPDEPDPEPCLFERKDGFVVLWDGSLARCCIDLEAVESTLTIADLNQGMVFPFSPIALCATCNAMRIDEEL